MKEGGEEAVVLAWNPRPTDELEVKLVHIMQMGTFTYPQMLTLSQEPNTFLMILKSGMIEWKNTRYDLIELIDFSVTYPARNIDFWMDFELDGVPMHQVRQEVWQRVQACYDKHPKLAAKRKCPPVKEDESPKKQKMNPLSVLDGFDEEEDEGKGDIVVPFADSSSTSSEDDGVGEDDNSPSTTLAPAESSSESSEFGSKELYEFECKLSNYMMEREEEEGIINQQELATALGLDPIQCNLYIEALCTQDKVCRIGEDQFIVSANQGE